MPAVIMMSLTESERGWGIRPDGASFHLNREDAKQYEEEYWDRMPKEVPDEYSRPCAPKIVDVDNKLYEMIKESKNGIRFFSSSEYRKHILMG